MPTVLVDRFADHRFDEVCVENVEATASLVAHLVEGGHTRIGFISGKAGLSTTTERLAGYRLGLERAGLAYDRRKVRSGASPGSNRPARRCRRCSDAPNPPTAFVPANNAMTIGVLRGLRDRGVRVPDDVAVAAFDDFAWADLMNPGLTAIAQPIPEMGNVAAKMLIKRIAGYDGPTPQRRG